MESEILKLMNEADFKSKHHPEYPRFGKENVNLVATVVYPEEAYQ